MSVINFGLPWFFQIRETFDCKSLGDIQACKQVNDYFSWLCNLSSDCESNCNHIKMNNWIAVEQDIERRIVASPWSQIFLTKSEAKKMKFFSSRVQAIAFLEDLKIETRNKFWTWAICQTYNFVPVKKSQILVKRFIPSRNMLFSKLNKEPSKRFLLDTATLYGGENFNRCASLGDCDALWEKILSWCPTIAAEAAVAWMGIDEDETPYSVPIKDCIEFQITRKRVILRPRVIEPVTFDLSLHSLDTDGGLKIKLTRPLGIGAFGVVYAGVMGDDSMKMISQVAVKFNRLLPKNGLTFHPMSRDLEGFKMAENCTNWTVKLLDVIEGADSALQEPFKIIQTPDYADDEDLDVWILVPGLVMEFMEIYDPRDSEVFDRHYGLCVYLQVLLAIRDLHDAGLVHEDLHRGNLATLGDQSTVIKFRKTKSRDPRLIIGREHLKEKYAGSRFISQVDVICPRMKLLDTGSINSLDGTAAVPMDKVSKLISKEERKSTPEKFYCRYLEMIHTEFTEPYRDSHYLIGTLLDDVLKGTSCTEDDFVFDERLINSAYRLAIARKRNNNLIPLTVYKEINLRKDEEIGCMNDN
jgi:hypothetical protein